MPVFGPADPSGHRAAAFACCERDGRLLLVRNPRVVAGERASVWDLPGGAARRDETLAQALGREVREETGLDVVAGDLLLVVDGRKVRSEVGSLLYTWRAHVFRAEVEGAPRAGPGIEEVAWVPRAEAAARLVAPYHAPLRAWLGGDPRRYRTVVWTDPAPPAEEPGRPPLRFLLLAAVAAARGDPDGVAAETAAALAAGDLPARVAEALLQVVPYAGFPRAIAAFAAARPLLGAAGAESETPRDGAPAFRAVYGETAARVEAGLAALHPTLKAWTFDFAYGRVLSRPGLSPVEREVLAVGILAAMGGLPDPFLGHARAALRLGASRGDLAAVVQSLPPDVSDDRRQEALALLGRA
jgi:alkylhydroperoxidase/carboxymuconolactone decarboxylase family protein YurZ/ADP-ribose pyrophosphatase YjhB (NUDIX family)